MSELSANLPVVSMTMSKVFHDVAATHSEPALLSLGGTSRAPPQGLLGIKSPVSLPLLVTVDVKVHNFTGTWANAFTYISCKFMSSFIICSCQRATGTVL